jgi:tRNA threonylcarbamoyladenosine biosynthesis protein TsaE
MADRGKGAGSAWSPPGKDTGSTWSPPGKDTGSAWSPPGREGGFAFTPKASANAGMPQEFVTSSAEETIAKGREIAARLRAPAIVMLRGELGSGKTTLTKGIISGLGAAREEEVTSPTFTLVHLFHSEEIANSRQNPQPCKIYHVDLYRVESFIDLESLGLEDALSEQAIVIVEWPDRFTFRTDWPRVDIRLEHAGDDSRRMVISGLSSEYR